MIDMASESIAAIMRLTPRDRTLVEVLNEVRQTLFIDRYSSKSGLTTSTANFAWCSISVHIMAPSREPWHTGPVSSGWSPPTPRRVFSDGWAECASPPS